MLHTINPANGAVSTHSVAAYHICEHVGVLYTATDAGLAALDPAGDAWEPLDLELGEMDLGGGELVGLPWLEVEVGATEPLTLTLTAVREGSQRKSVSYTIRPKDAAPQWRRVDLGRMPQGRRWALRLANTGDDAVQINGLRLHPVAARR
jgi:hypothetical protein